MIKRGVRIRALARNSACFSGKIRCAVRRSGDPGGRTWVQVNEETNVLHNFHWNQSGRLRRTFRVLNVPVSCLRPVGQQEPFCIFRRTRIHTAIRRGQTLLRKTTIRKRQWNRSLLFFTIFYYQSFCYILLFRPYSCQRPPSASGAPTSLHGAAAQPAEIPRSARHFVLFNRRLTASSASLAPAQLLPSRTRRRGRKKYTTRHFLIVR